jgi:hypothetical protein
MTEYCEIDSNANNYLIYLFNSVVSVIIIADKNRDFV